MELCTITTTITNLPSNTTNQNHGYLTGNAVFNRRISLPPLHRNSLNLQSRGVLRCTGKFPGETSTEVNDFLVEKKNKPEETLLNNLNGEAQSESSSEEDEQQQTQTLEFLNDFKIDSDNTYTILLYGSGAIVALYLTSAIIGSLESIPLFPKLMEVVGLGYTLWFTTRYLLFKKNREELKMKISEIKKQVLGSDNE